MRIARVFLEQDLRQGFQGLHRVLRNSKINPDNIDHKKVYIFMNRACTKFKVISGRYLVYYNNGNRRIPLEAISYLPENFGGTEAEMSSAIRKSVNKALDIR